MTLLWINLLETDIGNNNKIIIKIKKLGQIYFVQLQMNIKRCRNSTVTSPLHVNVVHLPGIRFVLEARDILAVTQQMSKREMTR